MSPNAQQFPKTYSASIGWKVFLAVIGFSLGIGGLAGTWYFGTGHEVRHDTSMYMLVGISLAMTVLGSYCAAIPIFLKILVLKESELLIPGFFNNRVVQRSDISGYRIRVNQGIKILQLELITKNGKSKKSNVTLLFAPDEVFIHWFDSVPNIDSVELAASLQEVQSDERLGRSPEERLVNVANARKIGRVLTIISWAIAAWAMFYPRPYTLVFFALTSLPLIALWLCWRYSAIFIIDDTGKSTARVDLTAILAMPGFILALRALKDVHLVDNMGLLTPTLCALAALVAVIAWIAPIYRRKLGRLALVAVLMSAYPASAIAIANALFDKSLSEQLVLPVLGKRHTTGKGATQYLSIPPSNTDHGLSEVQVSRDLYQHVGIGQSICLSLHPGVFGLSWYLVEPTSACVK